MTKNEIPALVPTIDPATGLRFAEAGEATSTDNATIEWKVEAIEGDNATVEFTGSAYTVEGIDEMIAKLTALRTIAAQAQAIRGE